MTTTLTTECDACHTQMSAYVQGAWARVHWHNHDWDMCPDCAKRVLTLMGLDVTVTARRGFMVPPDNGGATPV